MFSIFSLVKETAFKIIHHLGFPKQRLQGSLETSSDFLMIFFFFFGSSYVMMWTENAQLLL